MIRVFPRIVFLIIYQIVLEFNHNSLTWPSSLRHQFEKRGVTGSIPGEEIWFASSGKYPRPIGDQIYLPLTFFLDACLKFDTK